MNKFLIFGIFLLIINTMPVESFFTESHLYWTIKGFESTDSSITRECNGKLSILLDGNTAADVPVLHYFDKNTVTSYISTHTQGAGYQTCLLEASADVEKRCFCYGVGTHIVEDVFSHLEDGLVPKYLKKFLGTNLFGHMVIERDFEKKHVALVLTRTSEPWIQKGELQSYNGIILNNLFEETDRKSVV